MPEKKRVEFFIWPFEILEPEEEGDLSRAAWYPDMPIGKYVCIAKETWENLVTNLTADGHQVQFEAGTDPNAEPS